MRNQRIPETDSIEELAAFWDTHDLTGFEDQLEEVSKPIFVHGKPSIVEISLRPSEIRTLKHIARSEGIEEASLLRQWIVGKLTGPTSPPRLQKRRTRRG